MKKMFLGIILIIMLVVSCAGSAKSTENSTATSGLITLDQALSEAASRIDERISAGSKIAPLNFNSPHDKFSNYVLEELTANLVENRKLTVVDRKEIDLIRNEFDFQFSGEVGDDSMQAIGKMLGAQSIISGNFTDMGGFIRIMIRVLNVQNASVEVQYRANIISDTVTMALLTGGKSNVIATTTRQNISGGNSQTAQVLQQTPQTPIIPPTPTYKIGETGPAGGIIFYDKGNNSSGWRYLEAAPQNTEFVALLNPLPGGGGWFPSQGNWNETDLGKGLANTKAIVAFISSRGGGFGSAAWDCNDLVVNGFDDWYLPSQSELNYMYGNLHRRGLGGFTGGLYWSSTIQGSLAAFSINFLDGSIQTSGIQEVRLRVRACRQF